MTEAVLMELERRRHQAVQARRRWNNVTAEAAG
jgi:hypothetical protein